MPFPLEPGARELSLPGNKPDYTYVNGWPDVSVMVPRPLILALLGNINH